VYELQFDGLFRRIGENTKTGVMAYGWLIYRRGVIVARGYGVFAGRAEATSNVAEYLALIEGLTALQDMGVNGEPIIISGDSKIVISQMNGQSAIHAERMKELNQGATDLASHFAQLQFEWRKRSQNKAADLLTRHALKQAKKNQRHYNAVVESLAASRGSYRSRRSTLIESFQPLVALSVFRPSGLAM
jgi:ribonuclease HI